MRDHDWFHGWDGPFDRPDYGHPLQDHEAKGAACSAPQGGTMKPSIGRIVHYFDQDGATHAALIVEVFESSGTVALQVFDRDGTRRFLHHVAHRDAHPDAERALICWDWPERVA